MIEQFTPYEYLLIDVANQFGLDKEIWAKRIQWTVDNDADLESLDSKADEPFLYRKAVRALRAVQEGKPTGHIMGFDATASGLQVMGAAMGCRRTCEEVNLIDTGERRDIYASMAEYMQSKGANVTRSVLKKPLMTTFYGSTAQPKKIFGDGSDALKAYYAALNDRLPGAYALMKIIQSFWNPKTTHYHWVMPDKHHVLVAVMQPQDKKIEVDEHNHMRFTFRKHVFTPQDKGRSLAANVVHSIDALVCRAMILRAREQGYHLAPIHDCFYVSPKHMEQTRKNYNEIMSVVGKSNLVGNILSQISGRKITLPKFDMSVYADILDANYAIC